MGERTTFFTVDRRLLESEMWLEEPFDKARAWIDIIGRASYADTELCKRGELITTERALAARWQWKRGKVAYVLRKWEADGRIKRVTNFLTNNVAKSPTKIIVENYDKYQLRAAKDSAKSSAKNVAYKNNINNLNNISLYMPDGMRAELESLYGEKTESLLEDVQRYYESHPDKEFPGWKLAMAQFNANQTRWGYADRKKQKKSDPDDWFIGLEDEA